MLHFWTFLHKNKNNNTNKSNKQIKLGWALFVTYTIIQSTMRSEMCSLHLTHPSVHLEQWAADCAAPGEQSWTSFRSRDSNPQPWVTSGFKSNTLSIGPTTARCIIVSTNITNKTVFNTDKNNQPLR